MTAENPKRSDQIPQPAQNWLLSGANYRAISENLTEGIWIIDKDGLTTYVNTSMAAMLRYTPDEMLGKHLFSFMDEHGKELAAMQMERRKQGIKEQHDFEFMRKDGIRVYTKLGTSPVTDDKGEYIGAIAGVEDITERRTAETELKLSEERYRILVENANEGIMVAQGGKFKFVNPKCCQIAGYTEQELLEMPSFASIIHPDDAQMVLERHQRRLKGEDLPGIYQFRVITRDSIEKWVTLSTVVINWEGRPATLNFLTDITDRKRIEEERKILERQAQVTSRLTSIGEMASGIAHEINNPLTGVVGYAQLLLKEDLPEKVKKDLRIINDGAQRVADIVNRLLVFASQHEIERMPVNINEIIENTLILRSYHLKTNNIEVITRLNPSLPLILVDIGQIQEVFLNLIANAETEMKLAHDRGTLQISTELKDGFILITLKDDGPGIAPENIEKIFNPFFTTREVGQGTGLGLSICHGIISSHKGHISVESKPGQGTTFIVELPVITEDKVSDDSQQSEEEKQPAGKGKILVIDDEKVILEFLNRVLTSEGYNVETVNNAAEALEKVQNQRYSLMLLDIKMPGISGMQFYRQLEQIARSLANRVVFMTGDVMGTDTKDFLEETGAPYITKPFDIQKLKKQINTIFDDR
jgi:PAS domain S-box-containing protein